MIRIGLVAAIAFGIAACSTESGAGARGPVGACDTSSSAYGSCVEHLERDDGHAQAYCTGGLNGAWVAVCPTANRIASCHWPSSIQYWYTSYSLPLGDVEYQCGLYGLAWTTY